MKNPASAPNKSPLKWVGGKYRALPYLLKQLAATPNLRLIEPFVGGGSVFLNAPQKELLLNDANPDLVAFYVALKERPDEYICEARKLFVDFNNAASPSTWVKRFSGAEPRQLGQRGGHPQDSRVE